MGSPNITMRKLKILSKCIILASVLVTFILYRIGLNKLDDNIFQSKGGCTGFFSSCSQMIRQDLVWIIFPCTSMYLWIIPSVLLEKIISKQDSAPRAVQTLFGLWLDVSFT